MTFGFVLIVAAILYSVLCKRAGSAYLTFTIRVMAHVPKNLSSGCQQHLAQTSVPTDGCTSDAPC